MDTIATLVDRHLPSVDLSEVSLKTALPQVAKDPKQVARAKVLEPYLPFP